MSPHVIAMGLPVEGNIPRCALRRRNALFCSDVSSISLAIRAIRRRRINQIFPCEFSDSLCWSFSSVGLAGDDSDAERIAADSNIHDELPDGEPAMMEPTSDKDKSLSSVTTSTLANDEADERVGVYCAEALPPLQRHLDKPHSENMSGPLDAK